jgi:hypothetical protein
MPTGCFNFGGRRSALLECSRPLQKCNNNLGRETATIGPKQRALISNQMAVSAALKSSACPLMRRLLAALSRSGVLGSTSWHVRWLRFVRSPSDARAKEASDFYGPQQSPCAWNVQRRVPPRRQHELQELPHEFWRGQSFPPLQQLWQIENLARKNIDLPVCSCF